MKDDYALEIERMIFNWYYGGDNANPRCVFNAIQRGLKEDVQVLVPIKIPDEMFNMFGNITEVKKGDVFTSDKPITIGFRHLQVDEKKYFIPVFTSEDEMKKGEESSIINQSLWGLFEMADKWENCLGYIVNPWDKKLIIDKNTIKNILSYKMKSCINFVKGSVVDMHVDAIVNAANNSLSDSNGGVNAAIHKAAGPELLEKCQTLHGCNTGEAKITGAYNMKHVDYIIHTVGPVYSRKLGEADLLSECYKNSLDLALENGCTSIAFSGISTGACGYPFDEAAQVSLLAVSQWLDVHQDAVMNVFFCCFKEDEIMAYKRVLS